MKKHPFLCTFCNHQNAFLSIFEHDSKMKLFDGVPYRKKWLFNVIRLTQNIKNTNHSFKRKKQHFCIKKIQSGALIPKTFFR